MRSFDDLGIPLDIRGHYLESELIALCEHIAAALEKTGEVAHAREIQIQIAASHQHRALAVGCYRDLLGEPYCQAMMWTFITASLSAIDSVVAATCFCFDGPPEKETDIPGMGRKKDWENKVFKHIYGEEWYSELDDARHRIIHRGCVIERLPNRQFQLRSEARSWSAMFSAGMIKFFPLDVEGIMTSIATLLPIAESLVAMDLSEKASVIAPLYVHGCEPATVYWEADLEKAHRSVYRPPSIPLNQ